ncbi:hypothetical protein [Halobacteriovorax sp. YZS-1-1]|uniref:hypothetical protein n=1 Tax=unclassified Halobacteriovorax TaxID=2639665 RepID=UPI00399B903D
MRKLFKLAIASLTLLSAQANYELLASSGEYNYNLPQQTFWISTSLRMMNTGEVCFSMGGAAGGISGYAFLCGDNGDNMKRYLVPQNEAVSDFYLFDDGNTGDKHIVFAPNNGSEHLGIYTFNLRTGKRLEHENFEGQFTGLSGVAMNEEDVLVYRQSFGGKRARIVMRNLDGENDLFSSFSKDIGYVFTPQTSGNYVLTKIRMGRGIAENQPDRLYLYNMKKGAKQIVMQDKDGQPSSKITKIMNTYTVNHNGDVAVWTETENGTQLYASNKGILKSVLTIGDEITKYDAFSPSMNNLGDILIRGYDKKNNAAIFAYVDGQWSKVIGEGDVIEMNGVSYEVADATTSPFVHAPRINDNRVVAFIVYVVNKKTNKLTTMVLKKKL